ncbi:MAG: FG-GAP-like repeat-containing protein [Burkholderiaceae bacterium]
MPNNSLWWRRLSLVSALVLTACGGIEGDTGTATPSTLALHVSDAVNGGSIGAPVEGEFPSLLQGAVAAMEADAQAAPVSFESEAAKSYSVATARSTTSPDRVRDASLAPTPAMVSLGVLPDADVQRIEAANASQTDGDGARGVRTGVGRKLSAQSAVSPTVAASSLTWRTLADGSRVAALGVDTGDARAVRLGLRINALPSQARLRFYAPGSDSMVELGGEQVNDRLRSKRQGGAIQGAGVFWAPAVPGAVAVAEVVLPAGVATGDVSFGIEEVIHQVVGTAEAARQATQKRLVPTVSGSCQVDYACAGPSLPEADAALFLDFIEYDSFGYASSISCSGMLIGDSASSGAPFVLTANHCIGTPVLACDTDAYLFWRSTQCGQDVVDSRLALFAWGLEYLYSEDERRGADMALLRPGNHSYHVPAAGLQLAGWSAATQLGSQTVIGLHHPQGDHLMRSLGVASPSPKSRYLRVLWSQGTTEPGSSGSALLNLSGQVIGTLWGGSSACSASLPNGTNGLPDDYGRFSVAYAKGMRNWLNSESRPLALVTRPSDASGPAELVFSDIRASSAGRSVYQAARLNSNADALAASDPWRSPAVLRPLEFGSARVVASQDIDGDGKDDVVLRRPGLFGTDVFTVLQERDSGGVATPGEWLLHGQVASNITVLGMADFDGNGLSDLVLYDPRAKLIQLVLLSRNGSGNYEAELVRLFGLTDALGRPIASLSPVAVGDFNGTGRGQIVVRDRRTPSIPLFLHWNDIQGQFTFSWGTFSLGGTLLATPDINGDGRDDFLFTSRGVVRYALSQGGGLTGASYSLAAQQTALTSTPAGFVVAAVRDADGDGLPDLVLRHRTRGEIRIARNPGVAGVWGQQVISLTP